MANKTPDLLVVPAQPGYFALEYHLDDETGGDDEYHVTKSAIVAWRIDQDPGEAWAIPVMIDGDVPGEYILRPDGAVECVGSVLPTQPTVEVWLKEVIWADAKRKKQRAAQSARPASGGAK